MTKVEVLSTSNGGGEREGLGGWFRTRSYPNREVFLKNDHPPYHCFSLGHTDRQAFPHFVTRGTDSNYNDQVVSS